MGTWRRATQPLVGCSLWAAASLLSAAQPDVVWNHALKQLERTSGGRCGVAVVDAGGQTLLQYRAGQRFAMCSTFKLLLVAAVLRRADAGALSLEERLPLGRKDLLAHSPVTEARVGEGSMPVVELCEAALTQSDNCAANLLLRRLGGPGVVTGLARDLGDPVTRLDRWEPGLNSNLEGDPRDTTSPAAMANLLRGLLEGPTLAQASRQRLEAWLVQVQTGLARLRAGFPSEWQTGDKTGTGARGATNDVAFLRLPSGARVYIAAYTSGLKLPFAKQERLLAEVGRLTVAFLQSSRVKEAP